MFRNVTKYFQWWSKVIFIIWISVIRSWPVAVLALVIIILCLLLPRLITLFTISKCTVTLYGKYSVYTFTVMWLFGYFIHLKNSLVCDYLSSICKYLLSLFIRIHTRDILNSSPIFTNTRGIFSLTFSKTATRCFSKSSAVRNGTLPEQLYKL